MDNVTYFELLYAITAIAFSYITYKSYQEKSAIGKKVFYLMLFSNAVCYCYLASLLCKAHPASMVFQLLLFTFMDLVSYFLLDFTIAFTGVLEKNRFAGVIYKVLYTLFAVDSLVLLTNPIHKKAVEFRYTNMDIYPLIHYVAKVPFTIHLILCYLCVGTAFFLLLYKCIRTPKEYKKRYLYIFFGILSIILLNMLFLLFGADIQVDLSYPLYVICAYVIYKNTFRYGNSPAMQEYKRLILEYIPTPVALFDYENRLVDCNGFFLQIFPEVEDYEERKITLTEFQEITKLFLAEENKGIAGFREELLSEIAQTDQFTEKICMYQGETKHYHCHLNAFYDKKAACIGHTLVLNDVTKEVEAVEAAENANRAKSSFLSNMSHEIRTPINAVLGMDEMILRESENPQILEYAENIKTAGKMLLSIVNDILDISKIESNSMTIVEEDYQIKDIISSLHSMLDVRAENKGLALYFEVKDFPSVLCGDRMRIQQVIINLLTNAIKYTHDGSVVFTLTQNKIDETHIMMHISVKDTGIGIREEDMDKLFKTFQRLDESKNRNIEGTGLGLHLTKRLVGLMNGKIEVKSTYQEGSEFVVDLPQTVIDATPYKEEKVTVKTAPKKYRASFQAPKARILVVDDNKVNIAVFKGLLKKNNIQIDYCNNGFDAIKQCENQFYDCIFLDHLMPQLDGIETLLKLKQDEYNLCKQQPYIALTANAFSGAASYYKDCGFSDYLSKPVDGHLLEETLLKYLPDYLIERSE